MRKRLALAWTPIESFGPALQSQQEAVRSDLVHRQRASAIAHGDVDLLRYHLFARPAGEIGERKGGTVLPGQRPIVRGNRPCGVVLFDHSLLSPPQEYRRCSSKGCRIPTTTAKGRGLHSVCGAVMRGLGHVVTGAGYWTHGEGLSGHNGTCTATGRFVCT